MITDITYDVINEKHGVAFANVADTEAMFGGAESVTTTPVNDKSYVNWGSDNKLPYRIMAMIGSDEVMSTNKQFNALTCYGSGLHYVDKLTEEDTTDADVDEFAFSQNLPKLFMEHCHDMKYFYFCVTVLHLTADGSKIVALRHREACFTRFEKADEKGRINHIFIGNFDEGVGPKDIEVLSLLNETDPLGDLMVRMGRRAGRDGQLRVRTAERSFAIVVRLPTPGNLYYPIPHYAAVFRGSWYDIKRLIGVGKKQAIKNHSPLRYLVQINDKYWERLFKSKNIQSDPVKQNECIAEEKRKINEYLSGVENSGKSLYTGFYVDPTGQVNEMIKIDVIKNKNEGGDWSEDIVEASNILCYADNIHPNLVGATPGKAQMNNSGSDKRELFTLKQAIEVGVHDLMKLPHNVVIRYNGWNDKVKVIVPMITLTTLDKNGDAQLNKNITD